MWTGVAGGASSLPFSADCWFHGAAERALTRLDVGHEKSLDCGVYLPRMTLCLAVTLWTFTVAGRLVDTI